VIGYHKPAGSIDPAAPAARRHQMSGAGGEATIVASCDWGLSVFGVASTGQPGTDDATLIDRIG